MGTNQRIEGLFAKYHALQSKLLLHRNVSMTIDEAERLLVVRELIDRHLGEISEPSKAIELVDLDRVTIEHCDTLANLISADRLKGLMVSLGAERNRWWWTFHAKKGWREQLIPVLPILVCAFSLVVLGDVFSRLFLGGSDS